MKTTIFIVNESLSCAGGEKSLLNFLSLIDYDRYNVDLQLIAYGNEWDALVDKRVNILPEISYFKSLQVSLKKEIYKCWKKDSRKRLIARLKYAWCVHFNRKLRIPELACKYWEFHSTNIPIVKKHYDIAIGYAQGLPTFFVADKVEADIKLCWVNAFYRLRGVYKQFVLSRFHKMKYIVPVTTMARDVLLENFYEVNSKMRILTDPLNPKMVVEMSQESVEFNVDKTTFNIMTLGRLQQYAKGMDILMETARILKDKGLRFKWYVLGKGSYGAEMKHFIQKNGIDNCLLLLGAKSNPYPYLKQADIYVQTSREEGFGIAIAEARFLSIPIISTPFSTIGLQIRDNENGIITTFNPLDIANAIIELHQDEEKRRQIIATLQQETQVTKNQLEDFYSLIEA